jgi:hypothetical protein
MWEIWAQETRLQGKSKQAKQKSYKGHNETAINSKINNRLSKYSKELFCKKEGHTVPYFYLKQQKEKQNQSGQESTVMMITKNLIKNLAAAYDDCL